VLNGALSIYFGDATLASAFVARWCVVAKVETAGGVFRVREEEPEPRVGAGLSTGPCDGGEIASASGTKDHCWTVMTWAWTPAGDLNARSRIGISGSAHSDCPDSRPGRVAGSARVSNAQRLGR
jgi:hypothetical protein